MRKYFNQETRIMLQDRLWGSKAKFCYLFLAAIILLFSFLGTREIWTQEHRWADIVAGMFYRNDFWHPYLNEANYYDKPLLSYWLIAAFTFITGELNTWALRLPSAFAGLLAVWSLYRIGCILKSRLFGLMSGWILLTSYYFVFWARTSSADMLNLAGILFAVYWYFEKKTKISFLNYTVFFLILAIAALCKGLIAVVVAGIVIFPDLLIKSEWKKHLNLQFLLSILPALVIYVLPFWLSTYYDGANYSENGLYQVYRENILRYFQPFDHKGPIYTYLIYLPLYLGTWTFFFVPAVLSLKSRWKSLTDTSKWMVTATTLLFVFFTLSGSRRNYYVLPLMPFAILMTVDWIVLHENRMRWAGYTAIVSFLALVLNFNILQPLYYSGGGLAGFGAELKNRFAGKEIYMLDPESKVRFYLKLSPFVKDYSVQGNRNHQSKESLLAAWQPVIHKKAVFISRQQYKSILQEILLGYEMIEATPTWGERLLKIKNQDAPVAFIFQQ